RYDLDNVMKASRKMCGIVEGPQLRKIKTSGGHLCIFRLPRGYGFELEMRSLNDSNSKGMQLSEEEENLFLYEAEFLKGFNYELGVVQHRTHARKSTSNEQCRLHRSSCPQSLLDTLKRLLQTREVEVLKLDKVILDAPLLDGLIDSMAGQTLSELSIINCPVYGRSTHDDFNKFTKWI
ncbi:hypothetical protein PFISCL1PPCAC_28446, partial [Pristionchus fissidentatus]